MLDFQLKLQTCDAIVSSNPAATVQSLLRQLGEYGFTTDFQGQENAAAAHLHIAKGETVHLDSSYKLSPDFIQQLARFTELCYVQFTLDELLPRMVHLGWQVSLASADFAHVTEERIRIATPDEQRTTYNPTYGDMLALRHDLDIAEVTFIVSANLPEMLRQGWKRTMNSDFYGFTTPDSLIIIPFNDVAKAREAVAQLKATKAAADTATKLGL